MQISDRAYDEMVDLLARGGGPTEILRYRPSRESQERASYLLEQNKAGTLREDERDELERLGQFEHIMQLVKARARLHAETQS